MRLSRQGEYALKAMVYLGFRHGQGPVQSKEIAGKEHIPLKFLEQILVLLRRAGFIRSRRGPGGGHQLARNPAEISLADIIRAIDGPLAPLDCVSRVAYRHCPEEAKCGLRGVLLEVRNATAVILEGTSLADICAGKWKRLTGIGNASKVGE